MALAVAVLPVQAALAQAKQPNSAASGLAIQNFATPSRLAAVKSWGYQLQGARPERIARSPYDMIVVDYSRAGRAAGPYSRRELERMKRKADGSRRYVLAYLSIGEAEDYRFYWRRHWVETFKVVDQEAIANRATPIAEKEDGLPTRKQVGAPAPFKRLRIPRLSAPTWLGRENETWGGNFLVRYWDKDWQRLIFGQADSYLDRILAAGFDGVYLDRVDAYYGLLRARPTAEQEMAQFVIALARYARAKNPQFIVVPQNAEELLLQPDYLVQIDGIAKEDLFYGGSGRSRPNPWGQIRNSLDWLAEARKRNLPVFVIEYLSAPLIIAKARRKIEQQGFISYFGPRSLDFLTLPEDWQPPLPEKRPAQGVPDADARASEKNAGKRS